jgi:hypothetical protein
MLGEIYLVFLSGLSLLAPASWGWVGGVQKGMMEAMREDLKN